MDINEISQSFLTFFLNPNGFLKIALILILILFFVFTIVIARQISLLLELVDQVTFSPIFRFIVYTISFITILLLTVVIFV